MKFAHIADTHIRNLNYHKEYREIFSQLYSAIKKEEVDYIIHCGDIAHTKTQISPEFVDVCSEFLNNLANIAPTYVILGNHDGNLKNTGRLDALTPIVDALQNPNLHLLKDSGEVYLKDGFALNVLSIFDANNWQEPTTQKNVNIALYHGSISNCQTDSGWVMEDGENDINIFEEFDYALLGDIHKYQSLDREGRIRYPGSTIQQGFGESEDKGILIWDIKDKNNFDVKRITFQNPSPFITLLLEDGKLPDVEVQPNARVRIVSNQSITLENMKKAVDIAKHRFKPESVTFLNKNINKNQISQKSVDEIENEDLRDIVVQRRLIKEFLSEYKLKDSVLNKVLELNDKYNLMAESEEEVMRNVNWKLEKFEFDNLFNYGEDNSIDFSKLNGIVGVFGKNFSGKTSIIDGLLYTMFNTTSKNERKNINVVNFNKDYARGYLKLASSNGTSWEIERKLNKYSKKSKGQETMEVKSDLVFRSEDVDGTIEELNDITRNDTDKEIRKVFGTVEDFLLTSMSSQLDSLSFINEGSTKRKEIFAKFLDLQIFDKKFKFAKEESSNLKGALKRMEGRNFLKEMDEADTELQTVSIEYKSKSDEYEKKKALLQEEKEKLLEITNKIKSAPTEVIDIVAIRTQLTDNKNQIKAVSEQNEELYDKAISFVDTVASIEEKIGTFDRDKYNQVITKATELETNINKINVKLNEEKQEVSRLARQVEILDTVPCGTSYPACRFIKDAYAAKANIPSKNDDISFLDGKKVELEKLLDSLSADSAKEQLTILEKLEDKRKEFLAATDKANILISKNKAIIESLQSKIELLEIRESDYNKNKEAIEEIEKLTALKGIIQARANTLEAEVNKLDSETKSIYKKIGSLEQKVASLTEQQEEVEKLQEEYSAYELYTKCMHSNGIAYNIIKSKLPVINEEISKFLMNIVDFTVFFEDDGARLNIFIQHIGQQPRPLEMGSGAEKTIAAMAIRLAMLTVSTLPQGDIFILDEPGTALDEENLQGFTRMLDMVKTHFKTVLLISHLEALKDCVDMQISIDRKDGDAFVNQ